MPDQTFAFGHRDPLAAARAQAAFDTVGTRLQGAIDDAARDISLPRDQRAAVIRTPRERQEQEAAARKHVMHEERDAARARRLMQPPEPRKPRR